MSGVRQFRVIQHEDYAVTVDVVRDDRSERITREAVMRGVRPVLGEQVDVRVEMVERIAAADSGKFRYVISHAQPARDRSRQEVDISG